MTIAAQNVIYRSRRRVRVVFDNTLAAGAFSAAWFVFASTDDLGAAPTVSAALVVGDSPNVVELALGLELVDGAGYTVTIGAGVPATDASTTAAPVALPLRAPKHATGKGERSRPDAAIDALYGVDLVFDGDDFVEGPDNDLLTTRGLENVESALKRRAMSEGLQWRQNYGAKPRQVVDAPAPSANEFRSALVAQMRADDRVKTATASASVVGESLDEYVFAVDAQLIGNRRVSATIPLRNS